MFFVMQILFASFLMLTPAFAGEKSLFKNEIIVEHAQVALPTSGSNIAKVFMVIWNGTDRPVNIVSFKGPSGEINLVSDKKNNAGQIKTVLSSMPRFIPPKSEFIMAKRGHYLRMPISEEQEGASDKIFIVELGNGREITSIAKVLPSDSVPLDHHHGVSDR